MQYYTFSLTQEYHLDDVITRKWCFSSSCKTLMPLKIIVQFYNIFIYDLLPLNLRKIILLSNISLKLAMKSTFKVKYNDDNTSNCRVYKHVPVMTSQVQSQKVAGYNRINKLALILKIMVGFSSNIYQSSLNFIFSNIRWSCYDRLGSPIRLKLFSFCYGILNFLLCWCLTMNRKILSS